MRDVAPAVGAVTYDVWNTLLWEVTPQILDTRADLIAEHCTTDRTRLSSSESKVALQHAWAEHRRLWRSGQHLSTSEVVEMIAQQLCLPPSGRRELTACVEYLPPPEQLRVADHIIPVLSSLRERSIDLGLICDTGFSRGEVVRSRLDALGIGEFFTGMTFSDEVGAAKPEGSVFAHALSYLSPGGGELCHVGDLRRSDVEGARRAGWISVRYAGIADDSGEGPEAWAVIRSHNELLSLIKPRL